ncbi:HD domain-containing protein [Paenibacillus sp. N4]|uniref:HD-GYP domain-containing protein n=1 Tax=Paenibacillus vietnamensis TaxID=2590547 RepID=UPI001CD09BA5|nr:HD-GYP domain-containing protein [Paenibacillus vietnamensis]MCA0756483.1 HD domain-containing protein [Paenibacillus vietnamensis]
MKPYDYAGLRLSRDIHNDTGVLLLSARTLLTYKEIELLIRQNIALKAGDVKQATTVQLIDDAIKEINEAFGDKEDGGPIPCDSIHDRIVPMIVQMSRHACLTSFWEHLILHDEYTSRHSIGVALMSRLIGKAMGLNEENLTELTVAGFLHDIGKVGIPQEIINKPGKLTTSEYERMKSHTTYGFDMMKNTKGITNRQALVALQHHEREDGSGYPYGLKGDQIDPFSKIVAIADVFHAMISSRVYKKPIPFYTVLREISRQAYHSLDAAASLCFLKRVMEMMVGNKALLSSGDEATIIMLNPDDPVHPLVEVNGRYIDLSKERSVQLECIV